MIGNALQYAAIPCIFAMGSTIDGRAAAADARLHPRHAARSAAALPRPVAAGDRRTASFAVGLRARRRRADPRDHGARAARSCRSRSSSPSRAAACTGLGLLIAAIGLLVRETATLNNIVFGLLLVFCGANVPLDELPGWMATISQGLPLTHGIEAARRLADGASARERWRLDRRGGADRRRLRADRLRLIRALDGAEQGRRLATLESGMRRRPARAGSGLTSSARQEPDAVRASSSSPRSSSR